MAKHKLDLWRSTNTTEHRLRAPGPLQQPTSQSMNNAFRNCFWRYLIQNKKASAKICQWSERARVSSLGTKSCMGTEWSRLFKLTTGDSARTVHGSWSGYERARIAFYQSEHLRDGFMGECTGHWKAREKGTKFCKTALIRARTGACEFRWDPCPCPPPQFV